MEISFTTFCVILGFSTVGTCDIYYIYIHVCSYYVLIIIYTYCTILPNKSNQIKHIKNQLSQN